MARTSFDTTTNLRVEHQSPKPWLYAQSNTYFGKFIGSLGKPFQNDRGPGVIIESSPNALCQVRMEFSKAKGDKVTFALRAPLTSEGVVGDGDLEDNEEAMVFYDWSIELKSIGHAVRGDGDLSDRRVAFDVQNQAREALGIWMGRKLDNYVLCALSGIASADGNIAEVVPDAAHRWVGGQTAAGALSETANGRLSELTVAANFLFGPKVIEVVKRKAIMSDPKIRPVMVGGKEAYVMFLHPYQVKALKNCDDWPDIQKNANVRGANNPIFDGALGMWDGVWLHEWERIETRTGAGGATSSELFNTTETAYPLPNGISAARALFCGAQAVVQAYGRNPRMLGKKFDYGRKWGVATDCHMVAAKPRYNSADYGGIVVDTAIEED
jgi:N4-gp56 family major capsid protein